MIRSDILIHGVLKIEARVLGDWLTLKLFAKEQGPLDDLCDVTLFMPRETAEEYAAAINAVNDKGREVEGEPIDVPKPQVSYTGDGL